MTERAARTDPRSFVRGYLAAVHDYSGPLTWERLAVVIRDPEGAARRALEDPDWLTPVAEALRDEREAAQRSEAQQPKPPVPGRLYAIVNRSRTRVKIGWTSRRPEDRLASLQGAAGEALRLVGSIPGTRADEEAILQRFDSSRRPYGEWFAMTPEIGEWIRGLETL